MLWFLAGLKWVESRLRTPLVGVVKNQIPSAIYLKNKGLVVSYLSISELAQIPQACMRGDFCLSS